MSTESWRVSVVILNWNGLEDTLRCLDSLAAARTSFANIDIVVIDNGSVVDPANEILKKTPEADYLRLQANVGFAAGSNIGAKRALARGSDFILFLNNDTIVGQHLFEELTAAFAKDSSIGVASPVIYDMSDSRRIDYAGGHMNFALGEFKHCHRTPDTATPFETDYISGCCMMMSRTAIDRIGLFDEKLFAYFEDVDLCLRAQRAGFKTVCVPSAAIRHKGSASSRRALTQGTISPLQHYLLARNRTVVVDRYASSARWFYSLVSNPLRICFYVAAFLMRGRWKKLRWFLRGIRDGSRGKLEMPANLL